MASAGIELWKRYLLEREDAILYYEEDGFVTYMLKGDYAYILEIYVVPEKRNEGNCRRISEVVEAIIKEKGYKAVSCGVCTSANNWERSLAVIKIGGYKEFKREDDMIYLIKNL